MLTKRELLARTLDVTGCGRLLRTTRSWNGVLILNYHRIGEPDDSPFDRNLWSASAEDFDRQLLFLSQNFDVIGLGDLEHSLSQPRGRFVMVTFDDGYRDNFSEAFPILKSRGVGVAHCPSSNMKLSSGAAPVVKMLALDIAVGLGPDGPAGSNNDFNLFEEMDLAAKLQKLVTMDPQALPAAQALEMATIRGARALGLDRMIGSLEAGKRADMIVVRIDRPHAVPLYGAVSQLVYASKGSDVRDVMVNGKPLVKDGQALTLDAKQIMAKAAEYGQKVRASLR